ncbi:ABC transporter permease [Kitasatospora sp. NPDC101235]|uniref:ABC transporter permease n=1 Tax=Kitasatospora sp. NPDC101235 TaxID=3364101 RepID=UPI00382F6639
MAEPLTSRRPFRIGGVLRTAVLVLALLGFLVPVAGAAVFGFTVPGKAGATLDNLAAVLTSAGAGDALNMTVLLAVLSTLATLVLLLPTLLVLHLHGTARLRHLAESLSLLPLVVPSVTLVSGAGLFFHATMPGFLVSPLSLVPFYVVLCLPLAYRALDAQLRAADLRTLWAASSSLGAGSLRTLVRVALPVLRTALLSAALMCVALVLSEFAVASLLLHFTFPVYTVQAGGSSPRGAAALSFLTMMITWLLLSGISWLAQRRKRTES